MTFWTKIKKMTNIEVLDEKKILDKNKKMFTNIEILDKQSKLWTKLEILVKNRNVGQQ